MRTTLANLFGQRKRFSGTFEREGRKRAYRGWGTAGNGYDNTVLFKDIKDETGRIVADHLWFSLTNEFRWAGMNPGDVVSFDARVDDYIKGFDKDDYDYRLSRPTKVVNHGGTSRDQADSQGETEQINRKEISDGTSGKEVAHDEIPD